jgi:hypothetical protein
MEYRVTYWNGRQGYKSCEESGEWDIDCLDYLLTVRSLAMAHYYQQLSTALPRRSQEKIYMLKGFPSADRSFARVNGPPLMKNFEMSNTKGISLPKAASSFDLRKWFSEFDHR